MMKPIVNSMVLSQSKTSLANSVFESVARATHVQFPTPIKTHVESSFENNSIP